MFIPRHLLLYGAIAATFTATAQEMLERHECRKVDVREENGSPIVTIFTSTNKATTAEVLTNDEAMAWLADHPSRTTVSGQGIDATNITCAQPCTPQPVIGVPTLCQVIVGAMYKEGGEMGAPKAEVFRYRYKTKPNTVPTHTTTEDEETDGEHEAVKAVAQEAGRLSADDLRILPNPSAGVFTLAFPLPEEGGNGELYITDAAGRVVHRETVMGSGGQARTLDLRNTGKGTYVATIVIGDNAISKRLVIE